MMKTKLYEDAVALLNEARKMTFDADYESFEYEDVEVAMTQMICAFVDIRRKHGHLDDEYESLLLEMYAECDRLVECLSIFDEGDEMAEELMNNWNV